MLPRPVLGDMLKVDYIIDNRVKGSVTVQTTRPVKQRALLDIFDAVLSGPGARPCCDLHRTDTALRPYSRNARTHSKGQIKQIAAYDEALWIH